MIMVAAGTQDGRELVGLLLERGYAVAASVVSSYGHELLASYGEQLTINDRPLDEAGLSEYFAAQGITLFIDASHPYAVNVSQNAMAACVAAGIPYVRYERDLSELKAGHIAIVHSYEEAAARAAECGDNIFLTTGSRNLAKFTTAIELKGKNIIARVLPTVEVVTLCEELGLTPASIVALQGPFSRELNRELFRRYKADVVITKNSGTLGGTDAKLAAAADLGLPVIVIDRPHLDYPALATDYAGILRFVEENY